MPGESGAAKQIGRVLGGRWRLEGVLGIGGMAAVYEATRADGSRAALKLLHPELAGDPTIRARFLREGRLASRVRHPGVCAVLDQGVDPDDEELVFLVMELLEGETLRDRWLRAQKRMPVAESLGVVEQVLDVLAAAHAQGVVHRDVKPENVWLGRDGRVRLLDFGIARLRDEDADDGGKLTRVGDSSIGTPGFMPPEQARGRWDDIDGRADLYGVGAMFFTLVTGEYVHRGEGATELFIAAATEQARSILDVMPTLSPAIAAVVDRALQFEAERRFATADEMRAALSATWRTGIARATLPDSSAPPPPIAPSRPTCRPVASSTPAPPSQRRAARVFSAAFAVLGLAALAWTGFAIRGARGVSAPRSSAAVHERASAAPRPVYAPAMPSTPAVATTASAAASAPPTRRRRLRGGQGLVEMTDDAPAHR